MTEVLHVDNVVIILEYYTVKLTYYIKNFIRIGHDFTSLMKSSVDEIINYIILRLLRLIKLAI